MKTFLSLVAFATILAFAQPVQAADQFSVTKKVTLGGEGGWDYLTVDTMFSRLFISRSSHVQVMDLKTDSLVGDILNTSGVHGIALAYDLGKGFTSNGRESTVTVFDLKTLAVQKKIHIDAKNPDAILYDAATKRILTFNGSTSNVTVIDATTEAVLGNIKVDGKPEFAQADGKGKVYVNIEDKSEISELDPVAMKVLRSWPLAPGEEPSGLAIDRANGLLFSVCSNKMMTVSDIASGKVTANVATGDRTDGAAFDQQLGLAFSSNGEGTVTVVREAGQGKYEIAQNVKSETGARTCALDPVHHVLYLPTAKFGPTPAPDADHPRPRAPMIPGSFMILVMEAK